jgi:alpha-tubulin suppressor-like RCC1 family protein
MLSKIVPFRSLSAVSSCCLMLGAFSLFGCDPGDGGSDTLPNEQLPEDVGHAVAALESIPAGVGCIRITLAGSTVGVRDFYTPSAGAATVLDLGPLAPGALTVSAAAYSEVCSEIPTGKVADWQSAVLQVNVVPGVTTELPFILTRNPRVDATLDFMPGVRAVTAGILQTYALMDDGSVRAWGINAYGQLGIAGTTVSLLPQPVPGLGNVSALAAGSNAHHACAVRSGQPLLCWGLNNRGQLGDGGTENRNTPTAVASNLSFTDVRVGMLNTCARAAGTGKLHCWGSLDTGLAGDGTTSGSRLVPGAAVGLGPVVGGNVPGVNNALASHNQNVYGWGQNTYSQLGDGTAQPRPTPVPVASFGWPIALASGYSHSCAVGADGSVRCAGLNASGQLGDGSGASRTVPVVAGIGSVTAIGAGQNHTCALRSDRSVWCWGANESGQIGDGTTSNRLSPMRVSSLSDVVSLTVGHAHNCAMKADNSVWCWGRNDQGQLGDGTTFGRPLPVRVKF